MTYKEIKDSTFLIVPLSEQETTINVFRDSDICEIWSNDRIMISKLMKHLEKAERRGDDTFIVTDVGKTEEGIYSLSVAFPKHLLVIREPRFMSDERRKELSERAKQNFHNKTKSIKY